MSTQLLAEPVETMDTLPPYVLDMCREVESLNARARELSNTAAALSKEIREAATGSAMGACPEWCSGDAARGRHDWAFYLSFLDGRPSFIREFEGLARMGRLSEKQIAYGKALIASPRVHQDVLDEVAARHAARVAEEAAKAERKAARNLKGKEVGVTVYWTSKSRSRCAGVVTAVDGETLTIDYNGQSVVKTAVQVGTVA